MSDNSGSHSNIKTKKKNDGLIGWIKPVVYVLLFFTFAWEQNYIPSGSMEPTLETGDRVLSAKFAYGYNRYSVPFFKPGFLPESRLFPSTPDRGDIATFYKPSEDIVVIKRVIGLPGDKIEYRRGVLYLNDQQVQRDFLRSIEYTDSDGGITSAREYIETLPNGVAFNIYEQTDRGRYDNVGPYLVPQGHYFMMGDNRDRSLDSRDLGRTGYIAQKYLMGRADVTTFSFYDCDRGKYVYCPVGVPLGRFFNALN